MKFRTAALAATSALLLSACGSGSSSSPETAPTASTTSSSSSSSPTSSSSTSSQALSSPKTTTGGGNLGVLPGTGAGITARPKTSAPMTSLGAATSEPQQAVTPATDEAVSFATADGSVMCGLDSLGVWCMTTSGSWTSMPKIDPEDGRPYVHPTLAVLSAEGETVLRAPSASEMTQYAAIDKQSGWWTKDMGSVKVAGAPIAVLPKGSEISSGTVTCQARAAAVDCWTPAGVKMHVTASGMTKSKVAKSDMARMGAAKSGTP